MKSDKDWRFNCKAIVGCSQIEISGELWFKCRNHVLLVGSRIAAESGDNQSARWKKMDL